MPFLLGACSRFREGKMQSTGSKSLVYDQIAVSVLARYLTIINTVPENSGKIQIKAYRPIRNTSELHIG